MRKKRKNCRKAAEKKGKCPKEDIAANQPAESGEGPLEQMPPGGAPQDDVLADGGMEVEEDGACTAGIEQIEEVATDNIQSNETIRNTRNATNARTSRSISQRTGSTSELVNIADPIGQGLDKDQVDKTDSSSREKAEVDKTDASLECTGADEPNPISAESAPVSVTTSISPESAQAEKTGSTSLECSQYQTDATSPENAKVDVTDSTSLEIAHVYKNDSNSLECSQDDITDCTDLDTSHVNKSDSTAPDSVLLNKTFVFEAQFDCTSSDTGQVNRIGHISLDTVNVNKNEPTSLDTTEVKFDSNSLDIGVVYNTDPNSVDPVQQQQKQQQQEQQQVQEEDSDTESSKRDKIVTFLKMHCPEEGFSPREALNMFQTTQKVNISMKEFKETTKQVATELDLFLLKHPKTSNLKRILPRSQLSKDNDTGSVQVDKTNSNSLESDRVDKTDFISLESDGVDKTNFISLESAQVGTTDSTSLGSIQVDKTDITTLESAPVDKRESISQGSVQVDKTNSTSFSVAPVDIRDSTTLHLMQGTKTRFDSLNTAQVDRTNSSSLDTTTPQEYPKNSTSPDTSHVIENTMIVDEQVTVKDAQPENKLGLTNNDIRVLSSRLNQYENSFWCKDQVITSLRDRALIHEEKGEKETQQRWNVELSHMRHDVHYITKEGTQLRSDIEKITREQNEVDYSPLETNATSILERVSKSMDKARKLYQELSECQNNDPGCQQGPERSLDEQAMRIPSVKPLAIAFKLELQHHRGPLGNTVLNNVEGIVQFGSYSTVAAPRAIIQRGKKVWYEVNFMHCGRNACSRIGFATPAFQSSTFMTTLGVGDDTNSWGFDPFNAFLCHNGGMPWGGNFQYNQSARFVGVAVDMVKGQILFSLNGVWSPAISGLHHNLNLYPALSGTDVNVEVNFGDKEFVFGPPDCTYQNMIEALSP